MIILIYYESYELQKFSMANKPSSSGNLGYTSYLIFLIIIIQRKKLQPNSHILDRFFFFLASLQTFFCNINQIELSFRSQIKNFSKIKNFSQIGERWATKNKTHWLLDWSLCWNITVMVKIKHMIKFVQDKWWPILQIYPESE